MFSFHWDELKNSNSETERARPTQFVGVPKMALHDNSWNFPFKFDSVPVLPVSWKFYVEIPGKINGPMPWVCGIFKTREWVGGSKLFSNSVLLLVKLEVSLTAFRSAGTATRSWWSREKWKLKLCLAGRTNSILEFSSAVWRAATIQIMYRKRLPFSFELKCARCRTFAISQVRCPELKLPQRRPLRGGVLTAFRNYKFCPPKIKRNYSRTDGAPIISSRIMAATLPELVRSGTSASPAFLEKKPGVKILCLHQFTGASLQRF